VGRLRRLAGLPLRVVAKVASKALEAVDRHLSPPPPPPVTFDAPPRVFGHGPVPPLPVDEETPDLELAPEVVVDRQRAGEAMLLVDVREPEEVARTGLVLGALHVPLGQLEARRAELPKDRRLVLYCAAGVRSFDGAAHLREHGLPDAWSVTGGLPALLRAGATLDAPR
jgi:rhodanese-related sulfurtransferase